MNNRLLRIQLLVSMFIFTVSYTVPIDRSADNKFFSELYRQLKDSLIYPITDSLAQVPQSLYMTFFPPHLYEKTPAQVRHDQYDALATQEQEFLTARGGKVKAALEEFLGQSLSEYEVPRIAFCFSGGGYRAMIATIGFIRGAQQVGLLDATTYMAGLSGSTWALAPWIASEKELADYNKQLQQVVGRGLAPITNMSGISHLIKTCVQRARYHQVLSSIDIYGSLLANVLLKEFKKNRFSVTLSESHKQLKNAHLPLPIYTAITPNTDPYEWFECTPFEIGSSYTQSYIPTWSFGRKFRQGKSVNYAPEQPLGYMMGIFGSAFDVDIDDIVRIKNKTISAIIEKLPTSLQASVQDVLQSVIKGPLDDVRLLPSMLCNYTYKMDDTPFSSDKLLSLIDAGIYFNLPFPPLLRQNRAVDIIVVYDASAPERGSSVLHEAKKYATAKNLKFPAIDDTDIDVKRVTILRDDNDPSCPVVIYFPMIADATYSSDFDPLYECLHGYCSTYNFTYTPEQYQQLSGLAEHVLMQEIGAIKEAIVQVINKKKQLR